MLTARDVMKSKVLTVGPDTTLQDAARMFYDAEISGAPVVGEGRRLLGVVSRTDLLRRHRQAATGTVPAFYQEGEAVLLSRDAENPGRTRVAEVMTPAVLSATEDTPIADLARFMASHKIHRVVITREGSLRGIVTTMDLLQLLADGRKVPQGRRGRRRGRPTRLSPAEL